MRKVLIATAAVAAMTVSAFAEGSPIRINGQSQAEASINSATSTRNERSSGFGLFNRLFGGSAQTDRRNDIASDDRRPIGGFGPGITWHDVYTGQ